MFAHLILLFTAFSLGLIPDVAAVGGYVKNNCNFPIWISAAKCRGVYTAARQLNPGKDYWAPYDTIADECSMTIKIDNNPGMNHVYQIEYSIKDDDGVDTIWYDLSPVDGHPFTKNQRFLQIGDDPNTCPHVWCGVGATGCEWPAILNCSPPRDVKFWLC